MCPLGDSKLLKSVSLPSTKNMKRNGTLIRTPQNLLTYRIPYLPKKDRGSFKRNFNIYLIKELYCSKSFLKNVKDLQPKQQSNKDDSRPSFGPILALGQIESEAPMPTTTSMVDASINVESEEHREDIESKKVESMPSFNLRLGLSQPDNQSPVPVSTFVADPNTAREKDYHNEDDDYGVPLRFFLRDTTQVNHDLNIKKWPENMSKVGEKPTPPKGEVKKTTIKIKKIYCAAEQ
ncbi:hypothetical protein Cgig2_033993 [Carnegiea gigantea]|uniref:Uncharacterized protein n=1 Tax=Carnegiea gigantea TaxID=171969 RepID=A0A9Q1GP97_9CARY|nr:hypothetical protein Cgig2_033993 [Carnegiea gigantea]